MSWIKAVLNEVYGLFVDEARFALAIIVWLGVTWLILPRIDALSAARAPILFAGLVIIFLESTMRRARR